MRKLNVLVACEFSGTVRDAFIARGHHAVSCDLLPTEKPGPHYRGDVRDILHRGWDMMIAHPPCTYLTISGNRWLKDQPARKSGALVGEARRQAMKEAADFFMLLWNAPIAKKCMEQPKGVMSTLFRQPDQIIQPWQFGHGEKKGVCLWLSGLPLLKPTDVVPGRQERIFRDIPPGPDRWKERSRFFPGIAEAMADQWGDNLVTQPTLFQSNYQL